MKTTLHICLGACILITALTFNTSAQQSGVASAFNYRSPVTKKPFTPNSHKSFIENYYFAEISTKAVRHFTKSFPEAQHVQWYQTYNGVVAYFTVNSIKNRAAYDKKGKWLYNIRTYTEPYLPIDIRDQVRYMFNNFTITWINEISNSRQLIYQVQIEDKTALKNLSVCEGQIQIVNEFVKQ